MNFKRSAPRNRKGSVLVLTALLMVAMLAVLAFAVDLGYILVARTELQRTADAAAIAAAWQLIEEEGWDGSPLTVATADKYSASNKVLQAEMLLAESDTDIGRLNNPTDMAEEISHGDPTEYNAVEVRIRRTANQNEAVPLFFARAMGFQSAEVAGQATAAFYTNLRGFEVPAKPGDRNIQILPFALDEETWNGLVEGTTLDDNWEWDEDAEEVNPGADLEYEVNLFPQGTGSPGNRGTVDIGSNNNSTADIARQILEGISPSDLAHHGGELKLEDDGEMELNGDTGISAGVKDELASIIGEKRIIPIFSEVVGPGNNAQYTIVKWVGVRIMEVKLTGPMNKKRVIVQPAKVITYGAIPAEPSDGPMSTLVYSVPALVR